MQRILSEIAFAAGVAATLWLVGHLGLDPVAHALSRVGLIGFLLLALAHIPTLATLGLCWALLGGEVQGVRAIRFVWGRLVRDASSVLLPFSTVAGYLLGVRAVVLAGVSGAQASISGLIDIVVEQTAKAPYMVASIACLLSLAPGARLAPPALGLLVVTIGLTAAAAFRWDWVRVQLVKVVVRISRLWPGAESQNASVEAALSAALAQRSRLWIGLGLQLAGWFMGAAEAWLALRLVGAPIGYAEAVAIDGVYAAVRAFAFLVPAAVGVQEGGYVALCGIFGVDAPTALAFSLLCRARDVVISAPALLAWQFLEHERRRSRPAYTA